MKYEIVLADFSWPYSAFGTAKITYEMMTELEIAQFDWSRFLASRAVVFSWVTCPKLDLAMRCAEKWKALSRTRGHSAKNHEVTWQ